jgi:hypothetical protein
MDQPDPGIRQRERGIRARRHRSARLELERLIGPLLADPCSRASHCSLVLVWGKGSSGTCRPSASQIGSHPSPRCHSTRRDGSTVARTRSFRRSKPRFADCSVSRDMGNRELWIASFMASQAGETSPWSERPSGSRSPTRNRHRRRPRACGSRACRAAAPGLASTTAFRFAAVPHRQLEASRRPLRSSRAMDRALSRRSRAPRIRRRAAGAPVTRPAARRVVTLAQLGAAARQLPR